MHSFEMLMQTFNWWILPRFQHSVVQFTFCRLPVLFSQEMLPNSFTLNSVYYQFSNYETFIQSDSE